MFPGDFQTSICKNILLILKLIFFHHKTNFLNKVNIFMVLGENGY